MKIDEQTKNFTKLLSQTRIIYSLNFRRIGSLDRFMVFITENADKTAIFYSLTGKNVLWQNQLFYVESVQEWLAAQPEGLKTFIMVVHPVCN